MHCFEAISVATKQENSNVQLQVRKTSSCQIWPQRRFWDEAGCEGLAKIPADMPLNLKPA
jgi:hypothetical protein